ncbi:S8 family serine peptidase [Sphingomonas sp. LB-2]|uniref:S8 family peptidase n=1 Tax=Sphingomonas caeni TaxID=2984949 RepID=UPI0022304AA6|nr:S8 family peptidase [Sphingomonas caeni]MCW3847189.1 S8 family serine peptidase [Sphingomonas caeni]
MKSGHRSRLGQSAALGAMLLLAACSGGSGGGGGISPAPAPVPTPTPTPAPTPVPTPTPTPTPSAFDTAEYRSTVGAVSMNALTAYTHGGTGATIKIGIIDSGIDLQSEEFGDCSGGAGTGSCRILAASRDTAGNPTIDDEGGHGTAVAFTIAGRRNGAGTHGVAFDGQLLVFRADTPGSCATEVASDPDSGCKFNDGAIATAINTARTTGGVRVINISLGGGAPNAQLTTAMSQATAAGIIIVQSAGNDGDKPEGANPDPFTQNAPNLAVSHGLIIIAGSVGANDTISTFSNRAGSGPSRNFYLAAVGEQVRAPDQNNTPFFWSGTSFSAPQIVGAIALLAQAFPNLTGDQIVALLYASARDAGAPGIDDVYGRGILDLNRAFQPIGSMSIAGTTSFSSVNNVNLTLSAPMGDARQGAMSSVVLDGFQRAFVMDLAQTIDRQGPQRRLPGLMASRERSFAVGVKGMRVNVSLLPDSEPLALERLGLRGEDARRAHILAASVIGHLTGRADFAIGASESGNALTAWLAGRDDPAFLVARDPVNSTGFDVDVGGSVAVRQKLGPWGVTLAAEYGDVLARRDTTLTLLMGRPERLGYARTTLGLDRQVGAVRIGASATRMRETDTVLGARFLGGFGSARADSLFLDLGARADFGSGWTLGGSLRQGWSWARLRGGVQGSGLIRTSGFAGDIGKAGLFGGGDRIGLRVAQPLRVSQGGIDYLLPSEWDYGTLSVTAWNAARLNLAPQGRELDFELSYIRPFLGGDISGNLFVRRDPGNFAVIPDDRGGAVRVSFGF